MSEQSHPKKLGRYEIVCELGRGAMGVVYEGRDPNINRRVAIKTARRDVMESTGMADEMMTRFLREAQAAGALNHPNIITIYDAGEQEGVAYIAMEFIEGGDLRELLDKKKRMSPQEIVSIGATLCDALAAAHDNGIVHRDMKPANIMMLKSGNIKIADFGIAHVSDSNLTQEGALIGTPHYMSPEQFMGQKLDGRSDLFSVANILYEMLTGEKPFTGEALSTVMHHVIKTDPVPPGDLNFSVPDPLSHVIMKGLSKRPGQRYADGRSMAAALRESLKEHPDPAIIEGRPKQVDATVAGVGAAGATMVAGAPPPGAAGSATVVAVSAPDATKAGGTPEDITAIVQRDEDEVPQDYSPSPVPPAAGKKPLALIGGAVAGVVVLIGAGIALFSGGEGNTNPGGNSTSTPGNQSVTPENTILFTVYAAENREVYDNWDQTEAKLTELQEQKLATFVNDAKVSIVVPSTNETIEADVSTGSAIIRFDGDVPSVTANIDAPGFTRETMEARRNAEGKWEKQWVLLCPK